MAELLLVVTSIASGEFTSVPPSPDGIPVGGTASPAVGTTGDERSTTYETGSYRMIRNRDVLDQHDTECFKKRCEAPVHFWPAVAKHDSDLGGNGNLFKAGTPWNLPLLIPELVWVGL